MFIINIYGENNNFSDKHSQLWGEFVVASDYVDDALVESILKDHGMYFGKMGSDRFTPTHYKSRKTQDFYMRID